MPVEWRYSVAVGRLPGDLPAIQDVRRQVFIVEQGIPAYLEWDGQDTACHHVLATDPRQAAIGTGRLDPRGRIGRMAVLPSWRSHGVGRALLDVLPHSPASRVTVRWWCMPSVPWPVFTARRASGNRANPSRRPESSTRKW